MYGTSGGTGALAGTGAGFIIMGHQVTLGAVILGIAALVVVGALAFRFANRSNRYVA